MGAKYKLLQSKDNHEQTADALSALRTRGNIRAFQQVTVKGCTCFAVEFP